MLTFDPVGSRTHETSAKHVFSSKHYKSGKSLARALCAVFLLVACCSGRQASAQVVSVLHSFSDGSVANDGEGPQSTLSQAKDGNFYGTTDFGGSAGFGTVYKITSGGIVTILHSFSGDGDGRTPRASLYQASDLQLYGTTENGGTYGYGTVFKITTAGVLTSLHSFVGPPGTDGYEPVAGLIEASNGYLYGMTPAGGGRVHLGVVYRISKTGRYRIIHRFGPGGGPADPQDALIIGKNGNFYATTFAGGVSDEGTVFETTLTGVVTLLHSFAGGPADGARPYASLLLASDGNFYGTTYYGGTTATAAFIGDGTVFKITTAGVESIQHDFGVVAGDGQNPAAALIEATDGLLYGTTYAGGSTAAASPPGYGTAYGITFAGGEIVLHSFFDGSVKNDGISPFAGLLQATSGLFYGATMFGGSTYGAGGGSGYGTVYVLTNVVTISSLKPSMIDMLGPPIPLIVNGTGFLPTSMVIFAGSPLPPTGLSPTSITTVVPAGLTNHAYVAPVQVQTPGIGISNALPFTVQVTSVTIKAAPLTRTATYNATVTILNAGYVTATATNVTAGTLGGAATLTPLPIALGSIPAGATSTFGLTFPLAAGAPGASVPLSVTCTFTGGSSTAVKTVILP